MSSRTARCHGRPCACHLDPKGSRLSGRDGRDKPGHDKGEPFAGLLQRTRLREGGTLAALIALIAVFAATPAGAQQIGTAGAVNPASKGTVGGATKVIELGAAVIHKERVETSDKGSVQLVFIDKTTMNIGPNSSLVIDEFVYDPSTGTGKMSASLGKGVLRVVGGNVTHTGGATVTTPVATIGIRGGVAVISHTKKNCDRGGELDTAVDNVFGNISVRTQGGEQTIRRPGYGVTVCDANAPPSTPEPVSQAAIDATNRLLTSQGAQKGSYPGSAHDNPFTADLGGRDSWQVLGDNGNPLQNLSAFPSNIPQVAPTIVANGPKSQAPKSTAQTIAIQNAAPKAFALTMSKDKSLGGPVPYLLGSFAAAGSYNVSPVLGYRSAAGPTGIQPIQTFQAGLSINGQGASQTSTLFVAVSSIVNGVSTGGLRASTQLAANQAPGFAYGSISSPGTVQFQNGVPVNYSVTPNVYNSGNGNSSPGTVTSYSGPPPVTNYTYAQTATATPTPAGLGADRPAQTLSGYVGGLMRTFIFANSSAQSGSPYGPSYAVGGTAQIQLDPTQSAVQANFQTQALTQSGPNSTPGADDYKGGNYQLGGGGRGTYIDSRNFAAIDASSDPNSASSIGNPTSTVNGGGLRSSNLQMVTSDTVNAQSFFPGVNFCNCEYTRWGFWSADTSRNSTSTQQTLADRGPLMLWVAGQTPSVGSIPTSGSATYGGHVIANFTDGTNTYIAAGNFSNSVNFGNKSGSVSISNLDNRNYMGSTFFGADPRFFSGSGATISGGAASFLLNGQFFQGSTGPAQEMGGNITFQGISNSYLGSGIFAARR